MKWSSVATVSFSLLLASCSNLYHGVYEGNKNYKESTLSPIERDMRQTPKYKDYQSERDKLQQTDAVQDSNDSPEFNLKK